MKDFNLTENFTLYEFLINSHNFNIAPSNAEIKSLKRLCETVLQPLRDEFNCPINITSGLRSIGLNAVVGGKSTSRHLRGMAADIQVSNPFRLVEMYYYVIRYLDFHSIIYYNKPFVKNDFIHISLEDLGVKSKNNIMIYESGLYYPLDAWLKPAFGVI